MLAVPGGGDQLVPVLGVSEWVRGVVALPQLSEVLRRLDRESQVLVHRGARAPDGTLLHPLTQDALAVAHDDVSVGLLDDLRLEVGDHTQVHVQELALVHAEVVNTLEPVRAHDLLGHSLREPPVNGLSPEPEFVVRRSVRLPKGHCLKEPLSVCHLLPLLPPGYSSGCTCTSSIANSSADPSSSLAKSLTVGSSLPGSIRLPQM